MIESLYLLAFGIKCLYSDIWAVTPQLHFAITLGLSVDHCSVVCSSVFYANHIVHLVEQRNFLD